MLSQAYVNAVRALSPDVAVTTTQGVGHGYWTWDAGAEQLYSQITAACR